MVEIKGHEADRFIQRPPAHVYAYLVCGVDAGLVSERVRKIVTRSVDDPADPFQLVRLEGDSLAGDPQKLADEAFTFALFGGRRALWITAGGRNFAPSVEGVLKTPPTDCTIVVEAGAIKGEAPLRKLFARSQVAAVLECWPDTDQQLERVIDEELSLADLRITPAARQMLIGLLGADRLTTRAELAKLTLYAHGSGTVTEEDVETIVADAGAVALDDSISAAFSGDHDALTAAAARAMTATDPGVLMTLAARHAATLHRLRGEIEGGKSIDSVMDRLPRGIFGKKRVALATQLKTWNAASLLQQSERLANTSRQVRLDYRLAHELTMRALWAIAQAARRR
ncbi:MAG: polymerase subunit delta [Hyphomicrobiales bacterium]|nr:polymerase subunit delta [Hyphomicrobiales bacterium]